MKILVATSQFVKFANYPGGDDFIDALIDEFYDAGHDVRLVLPAFPEVEDNAALNARPVLENLPIDLIDGLVSARVLSFAFNEIPVYLLGVSVNGKPHQVEIDTSDAAFAAFFGSSVIEMLCRIEPQWIPDVIQTCDFTSSLIPIALRERNKIDSFLGRVVTVGYERDLEEKHTENNYMNYLGPHADIFIRESNIRGLNSRDIRIAFERAYSDAILNRELRDKAA